MSIIILASGSPRRKEILLMITDRFIVVKPQKDEVFDHNLTPQQQVISLSKQKADEIFTQYPNDLIIAADTIVECNGTVLGKPRNKQDAFNQLKSLSGDVHNVHTGVSIIFKDINYSFVSSSCITFAPMIDEEINDYIASGEPMDKAGSYAVQGIGGKYIKRIEGDFYSVMGLPLHDIYKILGDLDIKI